MCIYDISLASRAGPISERVVNPVALHRGVDRLGGGHMVGFI